VSVADESSRLLDAEREVARLRQLVEASKLVNSSIEGEALYESILSVARTQLDVERGTLYFVDQERQELSARISADSNVSEIRLAIGQGLAGTVAATGDGVIIADAYADRRFDRRTDQATGFRTRSILCAPIRNRNGVIVGVLQLLNKRTASFGQDDLDFLASLGEHMAIAIENARLHLDLVAKERMERELQLGREIQARLLPAPPKDIVDTSIVARCDSCYEVSGDFYDFLTLPDDTLGVALGDVSGKGVGAALVTASLQAALRIAAPAEADLGRLMGRLNDLLHGMTRARKYVTFFFGRYEPKTGSLHYVNAGHLPPVVALSGQLEPLQVTGKPIGLFPGLSWREEQVVIPPGGALVVFTDGFTEAMNAAEEELGDERWLELVRAKHELPADRLTEELYGAIRDHEAGAEPGDDKTLLILRRT